jgi:glutaredoxin
MLGLFRSEPSRRAHIETIRVSASLAATILATVLLLVSSSSAAEAAGCSQRVYLYSAWWCPSCRQVRAILARNNIPYTLLDATTPRVQNDMVGRFGDTAVPRTLIGRSVVKGVDEALIKKLCARGLRRQLPNQSTVSVFWDLDPWPVSLWHDSKSTSVHTLPGLAQEVMP